MSIALAIGSGDHQGHACAHLKERTGLGPLSFFTQLVAVVGNEYDDGVLAQPKMVKFSQHASDVPVGPGNGSDVSTDDLPGFFRACGASDEKIGIALADGRAGKSRRHHRPWSKVRRQLNLAGIEQIKKLLRRGRRTVRLDETAADKKWLVFIFTQIFNRAVGGVIVAIAFTIAVQ